ncbi:MAG: hypothetical protein JF621_28160 [Streptomyces turgidiscabies]|nr:hypothetical protein [Streptomyces turgidiscabies]
MRRGRVAHRTCDGLISAPDDVVVVAYVDANSGPGWVLWARSAHAHLVRPDPYPFALLARNRALSAEHLAT